MRKVSAIILTGTFLAMAVFGVFAMGHSGEHGSGCIAAAAQGLADCPKSLSASLMFGFHLDAFKNLSVATLSENTLNATSLFFAVLLIAGTAFFLSGLLGPPELLLFYSRANNNLFALPERKLTRWLALHENSPAASLRTLA